MQLNIWQVKDFEFNTSFKQNKLNVWSFQRANELNKRIFLWA